MHKLRYSIITICYNSESTIERTIQSVLAQTYTDFEYIIVDGASKDSTMDIVHKYQPLFEGRMKWISEPDRGIYDAMNKGIQMSKGDIVGIVNSDDWLESDALSTVYDSYINQNKSLDLLYCGWTRFHYFNGDTQVLKTSQRRLEQKAKQFGIDGVRHPAVFVPSLLYQKYGLFDDSIKIMADTDLLLRFYYAGVQFHYIEKVLSNMSDGGVSNKSSNVLKKYLFNGSCDYKKILLKYNIDKFSFYYLLYTWKMKRIIKSVIPDSVIKLYRNR